MQNSETKSSGVWLVCFLVAAVVFVLPSVGTAPQPGTNAPISPMLEDPESEFMEWPDWVLAGSQQLAHRKCQELAERYSLSGGNLVVLLSVVQENQSRYRCNFKSEVTPEYADELPEF